MPKIATSDLALCSETPSGFTAPKREGIGAVWEEERHINCSQRRKFGGQVAYWSKVTYVRYLDCKAYSKRTVSSPRAGGDEMRTWGRLGVIVLYVNHHSLHGPFVLANGI